MTAERNGQADLCHLTEKFESTFTEDDKAIAAANGTDLNLLGYVPLCRRLQPRVLEAAPPYIRYVGLYGGTSCAHYTIETEIIGGVGGSNTTCSTKTTGTCKRAA